MMCGNSLGASFKCFQQAFLIGIAVLLSEIGIRNNVDSMEFMPCLTPSDKMLDCCVLFHEQFVFCKVADCFNKGAIASACHEKGNRAGLGQLTLMLAF